MVDYQSIEDILDNSEYMFSKLFKFYSNESDQMKGKNEKLRFCINELNSYYDSKKELITREQDIFLCKLILNFFDSFENRNKLNNEEKFKEIFYEEHLSDILKENQYNELIKINKSENVKLTIENIISFLIKLLLKYSVNYKENAEQNKLTPEEKWNQIGLHLEFFEINEIIRKELEVFLKEENNVNVRNYFKEIDLITNIKDPENNSKILSDIYEYLQFKSIKKMKKLRLKFGGDLERENDDYARNLLIKETDDNSEYIPVFNKDEFANIKRILKRLDIKINLDTILNQNETKYYIYDGNTQITLTRLIETGFGNYNERNETIVLTEGGQLISCESDGYSFRLENYVFDSDSFEMVDVYDIYEQINYAEIKRDNNLPENCLYPELIGGVMHNTSIKVITDSDTTEIYGYVLERMFSTLEKEGGDEDFWLLHGDSFKTGSKHGDRHMKGYYTIVVETEKYEFVIYIPDLRATKPEWGDDTVLIEKHYGTTDESSDSYFRHFSDEDLNTLRLIINRVY